MLKTTPFLLSCLTLLVSSEATAQASKTAETSESDWVAYRNVYNLLIPFEKFNKPKNFIQQFYRIIPIDKRGNLDNVRLVLQSKLTQIHLPLDSYGRATIPLARAPYEENADLRLNKKPGLFKWQAWISIVPRNDGVYESADLHVACAQALDYWRSLEPRIANKYRCAGVKFIFNSTANEVPPKFHHHEQNTVLPELSDQNANLYRTNIYQFHHWPNGQIITQGVPIAIDPLFEEVNPKK